MSVRRLDHLAVRFGRDASQLIYALQYTCPRGMLRCADAQVLVQDHCVVRLYDAWRRFCRELVIVSAAAKPVTGGGVRLPQIAGVGSTADVLPLLRGSFTKGRPVFWEPRWAKATECIDAARRLGVANAQTIAAALGATPATAEFVRQVRNYIVHPGLDTIAGFREVAGQVGIGGLRPPAAVVTTRLAPGVTVFEMWVSDLKLVSRAAVQ